MNKNSVIQNIRIILAITGKDIQDAIRNKTILSTLITMLFIIIAYKLLPNISVKENPHVFLYDADHSIYTSALENSSTLDVHRYVSFNEFIEEFRTHVTSANLGLVLPTGFDQALATGEVPTIQGYVMHWVDQEQRDKQRIELEQRIIAIIGASVHINLDGGTLTMLPQSAGGLLAAAATVIVMIFMGITLIPQLIVEEKATKTIDTLLISPANSIQIVIAKALAGLFYCLALIIVIIIMNSNLILQWNLALLTVLLITLVSITLGLILGTRMDNPQQVRLVASLIMVPLLLPVFLSFMTGLIPAWLIAILRWLPPVAASELMRFSFTEQVDPSQSLPKIGILLASFFVLLIFEGWQLRRLDR